MKNCCSRTTSTSSSSTTTTTTILLLLLYFFCFGIVYYCLQQPILAELFNAGRNVDELGAAAPEIGEAGARGGCARRGHAAQLAT